MKNILFSLVLSFLFFLSAKCQQTDNESYYVSFWKQNLDTLCKSSGLKITKPEKHFQEKHLSQNTIAHLVDSLPKDFPFIYNDTVNLILKAYLENPSKTAVSIYYFKLLEPTLEKVLKEAQLPASLKYLPFALSAMNSKAKNKIGASGIWQLNYSVARKENLTVDSYVDERRNDTKATLASVYEIKQLFSLYQNWELTIAAYTCSPTNMNKSIRRADNNRDFYTIYPSLPDFGRDIVPAMTAAAIICKYFNNFNIKIPPLPTDIKTDTIEISKRVHFKQIEKYLNIPLDTIRFLNPEYKYDIVPAVNELYTIILPKGSLIEFNKYEDSIYQYNDSALFNIQRTAVLLPTNNTQTYTSTNNDKNTELLYYSIKSGDNLGLIASWYDVKVSSIQKWNKINSKKLKIGQKLKIYVPKNQTNYYKKINSMSFGAKQKLAKTTSSKENKPEKNTTKSNNSTSSKGWTYYTVKAGDSPYGIAKKYSGVSADDIIKWNNINANNLKIGQKLKIKKL